LEARLAVGRCPASFSFEQLASIGVLERFPYITEECGFGVFCHAFSWNVFGLPSQAVLFHRKAASDNAVRAGR
jgi:hypothetical protein